MRNMLKFLIETLTEENLIKHCKPVVKDNPSEESGALVIENLLNALIEVLVDVQLE